MKPYGFIYITTNLVNGRKYLGQCSKLNDQKYLGSGKYIKKAIKKYGRSNFSREIVMYAFSKEDLNYLEK